jgi:hypothetical protein
MIVYKRPPLPPAAEGVCFYLKANRLKRCLPKRPLPHPGPKCAVLLTYELVILPYYYDFG